MPRTDPLRNTLDHLALDPAAKDDRRYLVSMLRRLGYTESEIEEALGPEPGRVIEVEYRPGRPNAGHGSFTVVQDEGWQEDWNDSEVGFSMFGDGRGPALNNDPALAHGWIAAGGPVVFEERTAGQTGLEEEAETHEWSDAHEWPAAPEDDEGWSDIEDDAPAAAWPAQEDPEEPSWAEEPELAQTEPEWVDDEPLAEAQEPAWAEPGEAEPAWTDEEPATEETWTQKETEAEIPAWAQSEPAPEVQDWAEPADDATWDDAQNWDAPQDQGTAEAWDADDEAAWADVAPEPAPEPSPATGWAQSPQEYAVKDAPGGSWAPEEPFTYGDYTLHTRLVELGADREQRIYFFAKSQPKSGEPCPLPPGYVVEENDRTGLPFLRRDGGQASDNCLAITQAGTQCRNTARETSKYCAVHHGWRGPKAFSETS